METGVPPEGTWDQRLGYLKPRTGVLESRDWGTWNQSLGKGLGTWLGYPTPDGEQTENITLPNPSDAGGTSANNSLKRNESGTDTEMTHFELQK